MCIANEITIYVCVHVWVCGSNVCNVFITVSDLYGVHWILKYCRRKFTFLRLRNFCTELILKWIQSISCNEMNSTYPVYTWYMWCVRVCIAYSVWMHTFIETEKMVALFVSRGDENYFCLENNKRKLNVNNSLEFWYIDIYSSCKIEFSRCTPS